MAPLPSPCRRIASSRSPDSIPRGPRFRCSSATRDGARYTAPATIPIQASASTTTGTVSSVQFFNGAAPIGQASAPPYTMTWSNVVPGAYVLTASASNSVGNLGVSPVVRIAVTGPTAQITVTPTNVFVLPYGTQLFTATTTDALGNVLDPPRLLRGRSAAVASSMQRDGSPRVAALAGRLPSPPATTAPPVMPASRSPPTSTSLLPALATLGTAWRRPPATPRKPPTRASTTATPTQTFL